MERAHREEDSAIREDLVRKLISRHNELAGPSVRPEAAQFDTTMRRDLAGLGYLDASTSQEELERRNLPDRLRFFDARTWGLFAGGSESGLAPTVDADLGGAARRLARLPRGVSSSTPQDALHWVLLRTEDASRVSLDGEIAADAGPLACRLTLDDVTMSLELTGGPFARVVSLPEVSATAGAVYVDLSCADETGSDRLGRLAHLDIRVE